MRAAEAFVEFNEQQHERAGKAKLSPRLGGAKESVGAASAASRFQRALDAWDPALHLRGPDGRFVKRLAGGEKAASKLAKATPNAPQIGSADLRALARDRHRHLTIRRPYANMAATVDELRAKDASNVAIAAHVRGLAEPLHPDMQEAARGGQGAQIQRDLNGVADLFEAGRRDEGNAEVRRLMDEHGLSTVGGSAGEVVKFDPDVHQPVGVRPRKGTRVQVVRPGVSHRRDDGEVVQLSQALVTTAGMKKAAPAKKATPRKASPVAVKAGVDAAAFEDRIRSARQGYAVEDLAPIRVEVDASAGSDTGKWRATDAKGFTGAPGGLLAAVTRRVRVSGPFNEHLRFPEGRPLRDWEARYRAGLPPEMRAKLEALDVEQRVKTVATAERDVKVLDRAMAQSKLPSDVVVWRGAPAKELGIPDGDAVGYEWVDPAYAGTSGRRETAADFVAGEGALLRILAPEGTPAISIYGGGEGELLLARGLRYRVVADHGRTNGGSRLLDVEIVPDDSPTKKATPRARREDVRPDAVKSLLGIAEG